MPASKILEVLPREYGYVCIVVVLGFILNMYLTMNVVSARKKYGIKYPALYAPPGHKHEVAFNCIQRAHQNTLETFAFVMIRMLLCGVQYPIASAFLGALWVIGRFVYGYGYSTGDPNERFKGGIISFLADMPLTLLTGKLAYDFLTSK
ncbi:hypothetical protein GUITHDRAFT_110766 [Guillardia theta CCMP2712]|uniref:Glutathione S-transferase 3, mitochondrial n=2 Tax=Guillardia theta TaxID=55529 RepID=L1J5G0_GUITC|nr:hypothetical protein GUITHDRAFT_110766 [Guillardia theta CCMP2712]EKX43349.1 hypothetical protein GUITHDRAFT_110766 [Guillardia theta CCMP2712]|eukprot:XP_005830329.1 hypothetical protein GUITHDRAFT_110766 [Guillardia theta CCMP2712]